jgi:hypothetical protein
MIASKAGWTHKKPRAHYIGVEAVELLFFKKNSLFYGFQMHCLML